MDPQCKRAGVAEGLCRSRAGANGETIVEIDPAHAGNENPLTETERRELSTMLNFGAPLKTNPRDPPPPTDTESPPAPPVVVAPPGTDGGLPTTDDQLSPKQAQLIEDCKAAAQDSDDTCNEDRSGLANIRNTLDRASTTVLSAVNATGNACSAAGQASAQLDSAVGAWVRTCQDRVRSCLASCDAAVASVTKRGLESSLAIAKDQKVICSSSANKIPAGRKRFEESTLAQNARTKCQSDEIAAQQQQKQNLAGNKTPPTGSLGQNRGIGERGGSGFSPATAAGANYGVGAGERSELGKSSGGGLDGALGSPSADTATGEVKEYQRSVIGQFSAGQGGGGVSGKVTYSGSSTNPAQKNQRSGGGGAPANSTVNNGFYGAGGAGSAGGAFQQAAIAPVGGYQPQARSNSNNGLRGRPDLRKFLPAGGPKRVAASPAGFQRFGAGKDGLTGPRTNIFKKISTRYHAHRANLIP